MALHTTCDGLQRRDFLKVGAIGTAGFTLGQYMRLIEAGQIPEAARAKSAIFINLPGGPTHMDTFDLKPEASDEYRGEFYADPDEGSGHRDLRTPAPVGLGDGQVRDPPRGLAHTRCPQLGK